MSSTTEKEKRRLERLKKELDAQQKKLDEEKTALRLEKKQMETEKNKMQRQEKMLRVQKNAANRSPNLSPRASDRPRMSLSKQPRVQKLERELADFKKRYEIKSKQAREEKAKSEELEGEIRTLKRKLKNANLNTPNDGGNDTRRVKGLQREIRVLKKQLKLAMKDLDKQRNYYLAQLRKFKDSQEKWIRLQREAMKKKKVIVKYIFLDDIRAIKIYPKRDRLRHKVRVKTEKGEDVVIYINDVKMWTDADGPEDDEDSTQKSDRERDLDAFMEEMEKELKPNGDHTEEDAKNDAEEPEEEDEEDDEDEPDSATQEQINRLLTELHNRASDLQRVQTIYKDEPQERYEQDLKELLEQVQARHRDFVNKMEQLAFDPEELKEVNKTWEDEIYKFKDIIDQTIATAVKNHAEDQASKDDDPPLLSLDAAEQETLKVVKENLVTACKSCLEELNGRISDLMTLNDVYFHPGITNGVIEHDEAAKDLSREQRVEQLQNTVKERHRAQHEAVDQLDAVPDDDFVEEFTGCNQAWRDLIKTLQDDFEKGEQQAEQYVDELQHRTNDLERVLKVMKGDETNSFLQELKKEVQERHAKHTVTHEEDKDHEEKEPQTPMENPTPIEDSNKEDDLIVKDNKHWEQIIGEIIQVRENPSSLKSLDTVETDFKQEVIQELLTELKKRRDDLLLIKDMNTSVPEECEGLILETETRHNGQKEKLTEAKKNHKSSGDEQKDLIELQRRESILDSIAADNKEWQNSLQGLMQSTQQNEVVVKEHQVALDEMNGRINDLLKLKHMMEQKANKEANPQELQKSGEVIISNINERQHEEEATVEKMFSETKSGDENRDSKRQERLAKLKENNEEWRDAIMSSVNTVADVKLVEHSEQKQDIWWLDRDEERKKHIDSIALTPENHQEVELLGTYVNRLFHDSDDPIVCLYTPQPKLDTHHVLSALYDGELLCELVNIVEADFVDARVIHKPDALKPYPISNKSVKENVQLLIASLKAFGVNIDNSEDAFAKWSDSLTHFEILQKVIDELHTKKLKKSINLKDDPEIKEYKDASESEEEIVRLPPQEWLKRWLNARLGQPVLTPITDYTETLYAVMKRIDTAFATSAPVETFNADPTMASQHMVRFARTKWGVNVYLQANDLVSHHQKLQELFAAQLFEAKSGFDKKSKTKKVRGPKTPGSADDGMISFINSVLPPEQQIDELTRDMADGIVLCTLLDKMKPGCIHWKAVQLKPRQKFDKIGNCNYAMSICSKEFPFSLVGIGGDDIHNGNQKLIRSLLWQMMRYWSTKKLSELSFGGKDVKDEDILQWANLTIAGLADRHSTEIRSFKDKKLTTGLFYLELLKAVLGEEHVRNDLIYYNIPILSNPRAPDEHSKERMANARYAMTIIRMNGADLFILPEDLIGLDNKAVLSALAAIMTIAFTQDKIEHEPPSEEMMHVNDVLAG